MNKKWLIVLSAIIGGLIFDYLNIPAGAIVGSMLGTALAQTATGDNIKISLPVKRLIRATLGCYIGLGITLEGIKEIGNILGSGLLVMFGMLCLTFLVTFLQVKLCKWSFEQAFLSSLPSGLSEIGMNAEEFNVDPMAVTMIHLMRLITILSITPLLISFFR